MERRASSPVYVEGAFLPIRSIQIGCGLDYFATGHPPKCPQLVNELYGMFQ
jgi:hypothetical protein